MVNQFKTMQTKKKRKKKTKNNNKKAKTQKTEIKTNWWLQKETHFVAYEKPKFFFFFHYSQIYLKGSLLNNEQGVWTPPASVHSGGKLYDIPKLSISTSGQTTCMNVHLQNVSRTLTYKFFPKHHMSPTKGKIIVAVISIIVNIVYNIPYVL